MGNNEEKLMIETMLMNELKKLKNENFILQQKINKLEKEKETIKSEIGILEEIEIKEHINQIPEGENFNYLRERWYSE